MSVYTLPYNDNRQLAKKFNIKAQEIRCKCGGKHGIYVNTELIDKIEQVMEILDADRIDISSGNRCSSHDRKVGGTGGGMHTKNGCAMDYMLSKKGETIDPCVVVAVAQEVGFNGIGRIDGTHIHCDVRTVAKPEYKWLGDETIEGGTSGSIIREPNTYWNYYKLDRSKYIDTPVTTVEPIEKRLQRVLNTMGEKLDVDGIIGDKTMKALKKHNINKGEKGEFIKIIQEILNAKGYDVGEPDGIAGDKTIQAICNAAWDKLF